MYQHMSVKPGFDAMFPHVVEGRTNETIAVHTGLIHVFSNQKPTGHWSKKPHGEQTLILTAHVQILSHTFSFFL